MKILFLVTEDWFFCSHFIERAVAARQVGYEVVVLTRIGEDAQRIRDAGLRLIPLRINRRSLNPLSALQTFLQIFRVYRSERPDLVHQFALKPILLGSLAARLLRIRGVINAVVGMGYAFTSDKTQMRMLRPFLTWAIAKLICPPGSRVVFENAEDLQAFVEDGYVRAGQAVLIRGAGVDPALYPAALPERSPPMIVLVARMLWDKGVGEFAEAARIVRDQGVRARFVLIGGRDELNRAAIPEATLQQWQDEGILEWLGHRRDVPALLGQAQIACLPSYREGFPRALLEAMAAGLPCIATDVVGCREAVRHEDNGLLVRAGDAQSLAAAFVRLIGDPDLRRRLGARGRQRVEAEFSTRLVVERTLALYKDVLG